MPIADLVSIVSIALLGSFGHCSGMCGGIVIAYTSVKTRAGMTVIEKLTLHLLYNLGRVSTYILMGVAFGFLGSVLSLGPVANAVIYAVAGLAMIITGLLLLNIIPDEGLIQQISESNWYRAAFRRMIRSESLASLFGLGLLNGLLPCGFVYFFAIRAASTGDPLWGGLVMLIFGLSTIPAMMILAMVVGFFRNLSTGTRSLFYRIAGISVILYGAYTIFRAYRFLVEPGLTLLDCH